jgi:signal transduction histidine kinase
MKSPTEKMKILLVDDEEDIRDVLEMSLTDLGFKVRTAENGIEALKLYKKIVFPIVLTDIKMPGMDGIELLQNLKRDNPDIEVVMITGHGDMDLAIKSLKYEATDFITKPVNVDALEISLKRVQDRIVMKRQLKEYTESLEALVREKTELQDHLSSLGLMIGSISHSIKGLLTGLDGGMYLLDSGFCKEDQDQVKEGWEVIKVMVEKIRKLVLDILYYAKERDLSWERMDVLSFADDVARAVEAKTEALGIEFIRRFDAAVGQIEIDAGYVHSALMNILENALDACLKDTSKSDHTIEFKVRQDLKHVIFDVSDNGIGMDVATTEKIFTPFFSTKGRKGTGLGLFVSNKIIEQHGGEILVKSTVNQGTLFRVRIPKVPPQPDKRRTKKAPSTLTVE